VAGIEYPVDEHGWPPQIESHPLVEPLCVEILSGIREEATHGEGTLHPLWSEYRQATSSFEILEGIAIVQQTWMICGTGLPVLPRRRAGQSGSTTGIRQ
jgi:hypothetical protein